MATNPTNIVSPLNWIANITHSGSSDGYAIQWIASIGSANIASGSFLTLSFDSTDTPAAMAGTRFFSVHSGGNLLRLQRGAIFRRWIPVHRRCHA
ncbi:MAG: hypothetical protein LV479_13330 [Methylacidiphilales bacterium]|nr:hypothetical protein [Candidatus Methylacidiphilales bacterium]